MKKIPRFYIVLLLLSVVIFAVLELITPRKADWSVTLSPNSKMPYGTWVLSEEISHLFPGKTIMRNTENYYDLLKNTNFKNIIIINNAFSADEHIVNELLSFTEDGGYVFVASNYFDKILLDTLGVETKSYWCDSVEYSFTLDNNVSNKVFTIPYNYSLYFDTDSCYNCMAVGELSDGKINFIKIDIGNGSLLLNSNPLAFSNYALLKGNTDYVEKSLSLIPNRDIIWDEYSQSNQISSMSLLQFIAQNPLLRYSYYLIITLAILWAVFFGKRKQNIIPVIQQLRNNSLDFASTISSLYLQQKKHKVIVNKRILYFFDHLNIHYRIKSRTLDEDYIKLLTLRSGKPENQIRGLATAITQIQKSKKVSQNEFLIFNKKLEDFYQN